MDEKVQEEIKERVGKTPEIQYAKDASGAEIKFPLRKPRGYAPSKHQASKKRAAHTKNYQGENPTQAVLSNHDRIIAERAKKLKISIGQYRELFQKRSK